MARNDFGDNEALIIEIDFWLFLNCSDEEPRIDEKEITPIKTERIPIKKYFNVSTSNIILSYYIFFEVIAIVKK